MTDDLKYKEGTITLPIKYMVSENGPIVITTTKESEGILSNPIVASGPTMEEAEESFWDCVRAVTRIKHDDSLKLHKVAPFMKGPWSKLHGFWSGCWFTMFGIGLYFRHMKPCKGGWYVPFTKFNISLVNHWRVKSRYD